MKQRIMVDLGNLMLSISDAIDLASPLLAQHQQRVGYIACELAKAAQLPNDITERLFLAALLHDVGAFSVEEKLALYVFEEKNCEPHCIRGEILFRQVPWLLNSAEIIRHHHRAWEEWHESIDQPPVLASQILYERLDGSGYPFRCHGAELDTGARLLMVADLFTALAEDRPYRKGMAKEKIINILEDFGGRGLLDEQIIMLALDNYSELYERVNEEQAETKKFYENQFAG